MNILDNRANMTAAIAYHEHARSWAAYDEWTAHRRWIASRYSDASAWQESMVARDRKLTHHHAIRRLGGQA